MPLGGLLTHLAYVEDLWFHDVVAEQPRHEPWSGVDWAADRDWDSRHNGHADLLRESVDGQVGE